MEEFKEARESLRKEIIEAHIFLRTHNQTIPSETLEFIKCAALEKLESGSPKVENTTTPALNLHGVVLRSEQLPDDLDHDPILDGDDPHALGLRP